MTYAAPPSADAELTVRRWTRATWLGWIAGVPLIALFALVGESIGIGGAQALVGAGMGTGVGILQSRALRNVLDRPGWWVWSCAVGLTLPFLAFDLLRLTGHTSPYSVQLAVATGGVATGLWQSYLLRSRAQQAGWWILISAFGWTLAALAAGSADTLTRGHAIRGVTGALLYLAIVGVGGLILGAATGVGLVRLLRSSRG